MARIGRKIEQAAKPVQPPVPAGTRIRQKALPKPIADHVEIGDADPTTIGRQTSNYTTIEVTSSKGKKLRLVIPASYANQIPKVWEWTTLRYDTAQMIADGFPIVQIAETLGIGSRMTIYGWLEHPEFKEHVDTLISETSYANQRERIAGLNRLTKMLFDKLAHHIDHVPVTDRSVGALITGIQGGWKQIAQEKGEFVEQQSIQQTTNLTGTLATAHIDVSEVIKSKSEEERAAIEKEFEQLGDDFIRSLTGGK